VSGFAIPCRRGYGRLHEAAADVEAWLPFDDPPHLAHVELLVGLRPQGLDSRTLARVQHADLDGRAVDRSAHFASERIDLADQVALCRSSNRRVARH